MDKDMNDVIERIAAWLQKKIGEAGAKGAIVGLSGGVDSSVVAALAKKAFGDDMLGIAMPCHSDEEDGEHAGMLAEKLGIRTESVDVGPAFDAMKKGLPPGGGLADANLKPRLRMAVLYYFANKHNYLVLGTDNKVELMVGYFTKFGDGGVDILPIASFYKREVVEMARALGVPEPIITKPPSAGLWSGQTDEEEMGITYDELDSILSAIDKGETGDIDPEKLEKVRSMVKKSEHKRRLPEIFEL